MTTNSKPVLVVGATGGLGSKVVEALVARGRTVRALVRPGSDASHIEGDGVSIARGDMTDLGSLNEVMAGVDAVVATAAGYMRRRKTDTHDIDVVGYANLARAAEDSRLRRFVLLSIVDADQAPEVPHFHHKWLAECELRKRGVPAVVLRAPPFLDQSPRDFTLEQVKKGRMVSPGDADKRLSWVYTPHLAEYLAAAVDLPIEAEERPIDIGWDRSLSARELRDLVAGLTGRPISLFTIPNWVVATMLGIAGWFSDFFADMGAMFRYAHANDWLADPDLQRRFLGVPTPEEALTRWLLDGGVDVVQG